MRLGVAADGVEHDIGAAAIRCPHDGVDMTFPFVVDDHIRTQTACKAGAPYLSTDRISQVVSEDEQTPRNHARPRVRSLGAKGSNSLLLRIS